MPNYRRHYLPVPVFVTIVTHDRIPWLLAEADTVLAAMRRVKARRPYRHLAHVLLPDHLHWLFAPVEPTDLSRIVAAMKREVSWRLKARGVGGPLWQDRFYDHLIRDADDLRRHLDYIHYNPVRHGLVKRAGDYAHSSFAAWRQRGVYSPDWGRAEPEAVRGMDLE